MQNAASPSPQGHLGIALDGTFVANQNGGNQSLLPRRSKLKRFRLAYAAAAMASVYITCSPRNANKPSWNNLTYHQECSTGGYGRALPHHVLYTHPRQGHRDDSPKPKHLFAKCHDVFGLLIVEAFPPGVPIRVRLVDVVKEGFLERCTLGSGEDGDTE